jgi:hypothetical protein
MQILTGMLADRLAPQRVIVISGMLTEGAVLFALAENLF